MKHIKKKFQFEILLSEGNAKALNQTGTFIPKENLPTTKVPKDHTCVLITEENKGITAFQCNIHGRHYFVPEPDPVLIYFNNAYANYRTIEDGKEQLLKSLDVNVLGEDVLNRLYSYFGLANGFIIFLFTAIEAFVNRSIPVGYKYQIERNNRTELYNKEQIQRHINFDEKLKNILSQIHSKSFEKAYPLKYKHIQNLKEFRDSIVHTKEKSEGHTPFDYLFKRALNFKYEETLHATRDLLNYYSSDYIEECTCGTDW